MKVTATMFILLFLFTVGCLNSLGQTGNPVKEWEGLKGDVILEGSSKISRARMCGYYLKAFDTQSCDSGEELSDRHKISNVENIDNTLIIKISVANNCCENYLAEIDILEDSILNILYHDYGAICVCECNFCLTYSIDYSPTRIKKASLNSKRDKRIKYVMIDYDRKTLVKLNLLCN